MPVEAIAIVATLIAVIITLLASWLVLILLIRVVRSSIVAAIGIAAILLFIQLVFGVTPFDIWQFIVQGAFNITQALQTVLRFLTGR